MSLFFPKACPIIVKLSDDDSSDHNEDTQTNISPSQSNTTSNTTTAISSAFPVKSFHSPVAVQSFHVSQPASLSNAGTSNTNIQSGIDSSDLSSVEHSPPVVKDKQNLGPAVRGCGGCHTRAGSSRTVVPQLDQQATDERKVYPTQTRKRLHQPDPESDHSDYEHSSPKRPADNNNNVTQSPQVSSSLSELEREINVDVDADVGMEMHVEADVNVGKELRGEEMMSTKELIRITTVQMMIMELLIH